MLGGISIWQLLIVLGIIILVFGTKKLRNVGSDLGGAVKGFKQAVNEDEKDNPQAKVTHEEQPNTYDVHAEEKKAAESAEEREERK